MSSFDINDLNNNNEIINDIDNNINNNDNDNDNNNDNDNEKYEIIKSIETALKAKDDGNILYKSGDYDGAIQYYSEAVAHCPDDDHENMAIFLGNNLRTLLSFCNHYYC